VLPELLEVLELEEELELVDPELDVVEPLPELVPLDDVELAWFPEFDDPEEHAAVAHALAPKPVTVAARRPIREVQRCIATPLVPSTKLRPSPLATRLTRVST
jgi:hypothetical protein